MEVVLNTFTWDYFLSLMGPQHAGRGFLTWLVLTVRPAPLRYIQQVISLKPNSVALILIFRGLTAVGGGNCCGRNMSLLPRSKKKTKQKKHTQIAKPAFKLPLRWPSQKKKIIIRILSHFLTSAFWLDALKRQSILEYKREIFYVKYAEKNDAP